MVVMGKKEKGAAVVQLMNDNRGKSQDEICTKISKLIGETDLVARAFYRRIIDGGRIENPQDFPINHKKGRSTGSEPVARPMAPRVTFAAERMTANDIRAGNLERIREAAKKTGAGNGGAIARQVDIEETYRNIIGEDDDELRGIVPKFLHKELGIGMMDYD